MDTTGQKGQKDNYQKRTGYTISTVPDVWKIFVKSLMVYIIKNFSENPRKFRKS